MGVLTVPGTRPWTCGPAAVDTMASKAPMRRRPPVPLSSWCPEDVVYFAHTFLRGRDLAAASAVCREFYFCAFAAASHHFHVHFGQPVPSLPYLAISRVRLFTLVDRVHMSTEANYRDLMLWAACRGFTKMVSTLSSTFNGRTCEARQQQTGATPLILACEHGQLAVVKLLLDLVSAALAVLCCGAAAELARCAPMCCVWACACVGADTVTRVRLRRLWQGVDMARPANNGLNGMHVACKNGFIDVARAMIDKQVEMRDTTSPDGRTPYALGVCWCCRGVARGVAWPLSRAAFHSHSLSCRAWSG